MLLSTQKVVDEVLVVARRCRAEREVAVARSMVVIARALDSKTGVMRAELIADILHGVDEVDMSLSESLSQALSSTAVARA